MSITYPMKSKLQYVIVLGALLLLPVSGAQAAFDTVTMGDATVSIYVPSLEKYYTIDSSSKVESFRVNEDSIDFTVTDNSRILLQSTDKSGFRTSFDSTCSQVTTTCGANNSSVLITCTNPASQTDSSHTIRVTPTATCSLPDPGGAGGSAPSRNDGGGGGPLLPPSPTPSPTPSPAPVVNPIPVTTPTTPTVPTTPVVKPPVLYKFNRNLSPSSRGTVLARDILELQRRLHGLGYFSKTVKPNGVYGPTTVAAVKAYQKAKKIVEINVGAKTRAALNK